MSNSDFSPLGRLKTLSSQYEHKASIRDEFVEHLKNETDELAREVLSLQEENVRLVQELNSSKLLENNIASHTKKIYEDKIKKMSYVDSSKLIPLLIEVSRKKQGNTKLNWGKWLEIPENTYLLQINENVARKIFQDTNSLIDEHVEELNRRKTRRGAVENYALTFDGDRLGATDSYATTTFNPDTYQLWNGFTISFWVRPDEDFSQTSTILGCKACLNNTVIAPSALISRQ